MNMITAWIAVAVAFALGCVLMLAGWGLGKYTDHYMDRKEAQFAKWDEDNADIWYDGFDLEEFDYDLDQLSAEDQIQAYQAWK